MRISVLVTHQGTLLYTSLYRSLEEELPGVVAGCHLRITGLVDRLFTKKNLEGVDGVLDYSKP